MRAPVLQADRPEKLLVAGIAPESVGRLIAAHTFPPGWIASIYDRQGRVLARSDGGSVGLGQPGTPAMLEAVARSTAGVLQLTTTDLQRFYAGFARSNLSGWVVTVGVPLDPVEASLRRSLLLVAAAGALLTLLALGAALVIGRRIADPLVALAAAAPALVRGERVALAGTSAREISDLVAALKTAAADRESAQRDADEAHRLLRAVFGGTTDGVFVKDLAGRYVMINEAGARLIGKPVEDIVDHDDTALFEPDSAARIAAQDREVIATGEPRAFENVSVATAAGDVRSYLSTKTPYRDVTGRVVGVIGITRDITERRHAQEERERLLAAAEEANRTKDQFLAVLSHELRTPLNAVLGWVGMLRTMSLEPATSARALEAIDRNGRALAQLVSDLLDVSRIVSGKLRLDTRAINLVPVIEAALDAVRPSADAKGIRIQSVLDPRASPVLGDPDRLQQVVWNLVANAIKFTPRSGQVHVSLRSVDSHAEIVVSDNGVGIDALLMPYIFERFRQGDSSSTRAHGGLGLGLALVKHLTELHGGTVEADSLGEDKGATFTVKLPLMGSGVRPTPERGEAEGTFFEPSARLTGLRIVVVDDDPDSLDMLATLLRQQKAEVRTATSAAEALALVEAWTPDLVVADVEMPDEDGYSLVRRLRRLSPEHGGATPAVAVTAYGRVEDRIRSVSAGFDLHLPKPVEPAELIAVVANLARRR
ncbi:MAG: hypothetical protein AUH30_05365 [Candidatus Rokubacteria bacterium 13_1_40CM_68_15]|nr:MAG: hypothetical protein AUH30_05365 [Candidatus Rokubacteria bacterium 13_1_40CM_68_15]